MKNEIDDLLTAMFRNGTLNLRKSTATPAAGAVPTLEWDPAENTQQAEKQTRAVQQVTEKNAATLQRQMDDLTRDANAQLCSLQRQLQQDGVEAKKVSNVGEAKEIDAAFLQAGREVSQKVIGQEEFLAALGVAFRRPFVVGTAPQEPLGRVLVRGGEATGRHSGLTEWTEALYHRGVLSTPKLARLDLSAYGAVGSDKLFVQDLFSALKSGAACLVFEHFEECHSSVLAMVAQLFCKGQLALAGRYVEQKGMLVETGNALVAGAVSMLSAQGKYLVLLTSAADAAIVDAFGLPFFSALNDLCETKPFSEEAITALAQRELSKLVKQAEKRLAFSLQLDPSAQEALVQAYRPAEGVHSLQKQTEALLRSMSEQKLKAGLGAPSGALFGKENQLVCRVDQPGSPLEITAEEKTESREAAIAAVKQELSEIVGLDSVKEYIISLEQNFLLQQLRREKGFRAESPAMHMIFTGNPGTGKTTVARLVARYLKAIGLLTGGQLVEVTRADLVGQYVGHTAPLTQKAIQSALGGVLFIDEAYSLYRGKDDSFGLEAIDTLVKGMEDHRDELLVILAGYTKEMEEFLTANSGLRSRFPNVIEFADYSAEELLAITEKLVTAKGYCLDERCRPVLLAYYQDQQENGDPRTNGNGRMARNTVEAAILKASSRMLAMPENERDVQLLLPQDFVTQ